jgi:SAM-dependent methyltransferase
MTDRAPASCPLCGAAGTVAEPAVHDAYFGYPGQWRYDQCTARQCGMLWIANPLSDHDLAAAYARYYTHDAAPPGAFERWFARIVARFSARRGDHFALIPLLFREVENRVLECGAVRPDPAGTVLDLGCGAGERLDALRAIGWGQALGVDPDPVAVARGVAAGRALVAGQAEAVPLDDASVDCVMMHHVVEHLADLAPALTEVRRVLRPGGHLVITTPNPAATGRTRWGALWRGYEAPRHLRLYTMPALCRLLAVHGFAVRTARTSARAVPFMDRAAARATGTPLVPAWRRWWADDRAVLQRAARIRAGETVGEELFVVAHKRDQGTQSSPISS